MVELVLNEVEEYDGTNRLPLKKPVISLGCRISETLNYEVCIE